MECWYVVQTKPHKEFVAVENLERQGYTTYCPKMAKTKLRRHRWSKVIEPLFPRYLFVKLDIGVDNFAPIRSTIGVLSLVKFGNQPAIIEQEVINVIQEQEQHTVGQAVDHPNWQQGDRVEIIDGPFAGLNGIFEKESNEERVIILLEMLGRKTQVAVNSGAVISA